jgi:diguanylate cyclase (GGDEF)-like protein/PAS domain S-box-containing protein
MKDKLYDTILNGVRDGIYYVDRERKINFWNDSAEKITGYKREEIVGKHCYDNILDHIDNGGRHLCHDGCPLVSTMEDGITRETDVYLRHKGGYRVPVSIHCKPVMEDGKIIGAVESFTDMSPHNVILGNKNEIVKQAYTDSLTNLPNRRYLEKHLDGVLLKNRDLGVSVGIACFDIDFFKKINDNYGHDIGDEVLKTISSVFVKSVRDNDIISRSGGEEFTGVFEGVNEEDLISTLERIRMLIENSKIKVDKEEISVTISIGGTLIREKESKEEAIKRGDTALYKAKAAGRNKVIISL